MDRTATATWKCLRCGVAGSTHFTKGKGEWISVRHQCLDALYTHSEIIHKGIMHGKVEVVDIPQ